MPQSESVAATLCHANRVRAIQPFMAVGVVAIVAGGVMAAAIAHAPSRDLVWTVAYLVLVAGFAECVFGMGQAVLAPQAPTANRIWTEFWLFNLGNAGVIAGTLTGSFILVAVSTVAFLVALSLFALGVRGASRTPMWYSFHVLLAFVAIGSLAGLGLSAIRAC